MTPPTIHWYRVPLSREVHQALHAKSDLLGFLQTGGYLGMLALTGSISVYSAFHWPWYATIAILFVHGTGWSFMVNGFHELVHDSVFRTRWLNGFFLRIISFLGWLNHHHFWASHTEHHKYTLHPPADLEVVLRMKISLKDFLWSGFINIGGIKWMYGATLRMAKGKLEGEWEHILFDGKPDAYRDLVRWARIVLAGHATIVLGSLVMGWWMVPVVVTFAPLYGGALFFLLNNTQHIGLTDKVPDFRLCCRTILINPVFQCLYWHMNYHTEHHMYAAVPCYRLGALHRAIKHEMPECPDGVWATWQQIIAIMERQKTDPTYQYAPVLPNPSK